MLIDPEGRWWIPHPEDDGHWRHWDTHDKGGGKHKRWPRNSKKPWPKQKKLKKDQSWEDPSGDLPPYEFFNNPGWLPILVTPVLLTPLPVTIPSPGLVPTPIPVVP